MKILDTITAGLIACCLCAASASAAPAVDETELALRTGKAVSLSDASGPWAAETGVSASGRRDAPSRLRRLAATSVSSAAGRPVSFEPLADRRGSCRPGTTGFATRALRLHRLAAQTEHRLFAHEAGDAGWLACVFPLEEAQTVTTLAFVDTKDVDAVPLPAAAALFPAGLALLAGHRTRRGRRAAAA